MTKPRIKCIAANSENQAEYSLTSGYYPDSLWIAKEHCELYAQFIRCQDTTSDSYRAMLIHSPWPTEQWRPNLTDWY